MEDLDAFLRWQAGPLLESRLRSAYAEWLVHRALGRDPGDHRRGDGLLSLEGGRRSLAVSSAAFLTAPHQDTPAAVSFSLEQREAHRDITAWVFCLLAEQDPLRVAPQDPNQWRFWVVPSQRLHPDRRSIGLQPLRRAFGDGHGYGALPQLLASCSMGVR
ncbi:MULTISPECIES: hypothetical protein [Aphanothece]|uniref:hypothetical protein n=1 Tax=Aphanothece TaxID=1121 RepID=UPI00398F087A